MSNAPRPIDELWDNLHLYGYLDAGNSELSLPADNKLGSISISMVLSDTTLFPKQILSIAITQADPPGTDIVLSGTLRDTFLNFSTPAVKAIFRIDASGGAVLILTVAVDDGAVLGKAFPAISDSVPGTFVFTQATFTVTSIPDQTLSFTAKPTIPDAIADLWKAPPSPLAGPITRWADQTPTFVLTSALAMTTVQAGLLPVRAGLSLDAAAGLANGRVAGVIDANGMGVDTIAVTCLLPIVDGMPPILETQDLHLPIPDLSVLAPLFIGRQLAALIPARFPVGSNLYLNDISLDLIDGGGGLLFLTSSLVAETTIALLPANTAVLESVVFTFMLNLEGPAIEISFGGNFYFFDNRKLSFYAGIALPDLVANVSNNETIDVSDLIAVLPGVPAIPQTGIVIDTLAATIDVPNATYTFEGEARITEGVWSIDLGRGLTLIKLDALHLKLDQTSEVLGVNLAADTVFLDVPIRLSAENSSGGTSWTFRGTLNSATPVKLADIAAKLLPFPAQALPDVQLTALDCSFDTGANTFKVKTGLKWKIDVINTTIDATFSLESNRKSKSVPADISGALRGTLDIHGMKLDAAYIFSPTTTDITFGYDGLTTIYHQDDKDPYVAVSLNDSTVGDLFAFLLAFAEPGRTIALPSPWDALAKIDLPNLTVKVHLRTKAIEVDVDTDFDLGFLKLTKFALIYTRQYGKAKFDLQLSGNFLGQDYGDGNPPLSWDPLNDAPPAVPGTGTQVFDLEYFGLGQHLALRGTSPETMNDVIEALEAALVPTGNPEQNPATQLPGLTYDAGSDWLIGTRFTIASAVKLSIVFNDPRLYGLLVELSGGKVGSLAGLRFEILYRKISETIGVFHIDLTLPDVMRHFDVGEVSITLPVITIDIYTNGNFRIDAGFPASLTDFSRSASVQVLPFIGYGGFYFALLDGETSSTVPVVTNGNFSPVLEFGLALQVGVGKTIALGILSGGISITVGGALEGTLAWFNPDSDALPVERFIHLRGTVAVVGIVYATVDFGIIQAGVDLTVYVAVDMEVECYKPILLEISAGVKVRVSVKIVFIRISFKFSATITESFTIGSTSPTPWQIAAAPNAALARGAYRADRTLPRHRAQTRRINRAPRRFVRVNGRLRSLRNSAPIPIELTAIPLISQTSASDFSFPGAPTFPAGTYAPVLSLLLGMETSTDPETGTNRLLSFVIAWLAESLEHTHDTITAALIEEALTALADPPQAAALFDYNALQALFTDNGIVFTLKPRPTTDPGAEIPMALMAMVPELKLVTPDYAIDFRRDRIPEGDYERTIQQYFAELSAQFAARNTAPSARFTRNIAMAEPVADSLAVMMFSTYFQMLAKGLLQKAGGLLNAQTLTLKKPASLTAVANRFANDYTVRSGDSWATIAAAFGVRTEDLIAANPTLSEPNTLGQAVFIPTIAVRYVSRSGDALQGLADTFGLAADDLRTANPGVSFDPLAVGTTVSIPATRIVHTVQPGQTAQDVAAEFGIDISTLAAANPTVDFNPLAAGIALLIPLRMTAVMVAAANASVKLADGIKLSLGDIAFATTASDSFVDLAKRFAIALTDLIAANAESVGIIAAGQKMTLGNLTVRTRSKDSYNGLVAYWYGRCRDFDLDAFAADNANLTFAAGQELSIPRADSANLVYTSQSGDTYAKLALLYPGLSIAMLLAANATVWLGPGQTVNLPKLYVPTADSFILPYTTDTGDTLTTIAQKFFAADSVAQRTGIQSLRQWNGNIGETDPLAAGTAISIPYATTLANVCRQYAVTPAQVASVPEMADSALLAPRANLLAPNVVHTTAAADTLADLARSYDLTLEAFADLVACIPGLFAADTTLSIRANPGMRLSLLSQTMASSGGFTDTLGMVSRFLMNGLRLPAPTFAGASSPDADAAYPLYALTGQEYPLGTVDENYTLTLTADTVPWLALPNGGLSMPLAAAELTRVVDFRTLHFAADLLYVQAYAPYAYSPDRQPRGTILPWRCAEVPEGISPAGQKVVRPAFWMLPDSMTATLASSPDGALLYAGVEATTNADGSLSATPLANARYATVIDIGLQTVTGADAGTYLVTGADQAGMARLMALWVHLIDTDAKATLYLCYADQQTNDTGALASDPLDRSATFLLKTNLSTESHGSLQLARDGSAIAMRNDGLIEAPRATIADPTTFLQLLWECSVVKSGGFYLHYAKTDGDLGLPPGLFAGNGPATVRLVAVCDDQPASSPLALAFNNALLVGDNVDAATQSLYFEALVHTIATTDTLTSVAAQYPDAHLDAAGLAACNQTIVGIVTPGTTVSGPTGTATAGIDDTLLSLAQRAGIAVADIAAQKAAAAGWLKAGAKLQLAGNPLSTVGAADTLATISARYDFLDPAALAALNATMTGLPQAGAVLHVPGKSDYVVKAGDCFAAIAAATASDLSALAEANAERPILTVGHPIVVGADTLHLTAALPQGHIGFDVARRDPQAVDGATETPQQALDTLFSLLGFRLDETVALGPSKEGLPATPTQQDGAPWSYRQILSVLDFAKHNSAIVSAPLPPADANPYAGIAAGAIAALNLTFQDVLGNRTADGTLPDITQALGYGDALISPTAWPAATAAYRFAPPADGTQDTLRVDIAIAPSAFLPDSAPPIFMDGLPTSAAAQRAAKAKETYAAASYQLQQPDLDVVLSTSLGPIADEAAVGTLAKVRLLGLVHSAYVFLTGARGLRPKSLTAKTAGYADLAALLAPTRSAGTTGYPALLADYARINAAGRADLIYGRGTKIAVARTVAVLAGDTANAIGKRLPSGIGFEVLATRNGGTALSAGILVRTDKRTASIDSPGLALSAIALQLDTTLADGPGLVPGLVSDNADVPLSGGLTLRCGAYAVTTTGTESLARVAAILTEQSGSPVTIGDVAAANCYLDDIYPLKTELAIQSTRTRTGDTLQSLAKHFGPADATAFLQANADVPNLWPVGTMLIYGENTIAIAEGDTLQSLAALSGCDVAALLARNLTVPFAAEAEVYIPNLADNPAIGSALYAAGVQESLQNIVDRFPNWNLDGLVADNADIPGLFIPGSIALDGVTVPVDTTSTIATLAAAFHVSPSTFAADIADRTDLLAPGGAFVTPAITVRTGDTLKMVADRYRMTAGQLAAASATLPDMLTAAHTVTVDGTDYAIYGNDSFALLTARINADRTAAGRAPVTVETVGAAAADIALGQRTLLAPPLNGMLTAAVAPADETAIQSLGVRIGLTRDPTLVLPAFADSAAVVSVVADIPAQPFAGGMDAGQQALTDFAADFEAAFPDHKIATGPNPHQLQGNDRIAKISLKAAVDSNPLASSGKALWVVNVSPHGVGIRYGLIPASVRYFAPAPLTTESWNGTVKVPTYTSAEGLSWTDKAQSFRGADPEQWNQSMLAAIDLALSPAYAVAAAGDDDTLTAIAALVAAKADIAEGQSGTLAPILNTDATGLSDAKKAMKQQLQVSLSAAYAIQTMVQVDVDVQGTGAGDDPDTAPQLSGKLVAAIVRTPDDDEPVDPAHPFAALAGLAGVAQGYLVGVIADAPNLIRPGVAVNFAAASSLRNYTTAGTDTLRSIACAFGVSPEDLPAGLTLETGEPALFRSDAAVNVTPIVVPKQLTTVTAVADWLNGDVADVLQANGERCLFFAAGSTIDVAGQRLTPADTQSLNEIATVFGGIGVFAEKLADIDAGTLAGSYRLNDQAPPHGLQIVPQMSIATAKAALARGGSRLTTPISLKDPAVQKSLVLSLDYRVNQLEFDLHTVTGIAGYKSSSWLSFVLPIVETPATRGALGQIQIPIPLRFYPEPALVSGQTAEASVPGRAPTKTLTQWTYAVNAKRTFAAQDQMTLEFQFNPQTTALAGAARANDARTEAVIAALAAFSTVWPAISADLTGLAGGHPTAAAKKAIKALAALATTLQHAWKTQNQQADLMALPQKSYVYRLTPLTRGGTISALALDRIDQSTDFTYEADTFLFTADATFAAELNAGTVPTVLADRFTDYGFALGAGYSLKAKKAGSDNGDWLLFAPAAQQSVDGATVRAPATYRLTLNGTGATGLTVGRQILWPLLRNLPQGKTNGRWLDATQAGTRLTFDFGDVKTVLADPLALAFDAYRLDLLLLQCASGATAIVRNADLIAGATINPAFVYSTPLVAFPTRISPLLSHSAPERLNGNDLTDALGSFFRTLLQSQAQAQPGSTRAMRLTATFWQSADGKTSPVDTPLCYRNPILLAPLVDFTVDSDWKPTGLVGRLAAAMQTSAAAMGIAVKPPGLWTIDVLVYTSDDEQPTGILDIRNLYFPAQN